MESSAFSQTPSQCKKEVERESHTIYKKQTISQVANKPFNMDKKNYLQRDWKDFVTPNTLKNLKLFASRFEAGKLQRTP